MGTKATPTWYERDGKRFDMKLGRDGVAEALRTSPANDTTESEEIHWEHGKLSLEVATGPKSGKRSVYRKEPLNVMLTGSGSGDSKSSLYTVITGEKYADDSVNRKRPAIKGLRFRKMLIDCTGYTGQYPIVSGEHTVMGVFAFRDFQYIGNGDVGKGIKTVLRSNAACRFVVRNGGFHDYVNEYWAYGDFGAGPSKITDLQGKGPGRGAFQGVDRFFNIGNFQHGEGSLLVKDIRANNSGREGSSLVSVTSWGGDSSIDISDLHMDTDWNTGAIAIRFDKKLCELDNPFDPPNANIIGPGRMPADGYAHGLVTIDLRGSKIRTGRDNPGMTHKSSRRAVGVDSTRDLWLVSDKETEIWPGAYRDLQSGQWVPTNRSMELEYNGAGAIRDESGNKLGTRAIEQVHTVGTFSGWHGGMRRNNQHYNVDQDRSRRGDFLSL